MSVFLDENTPNLEINILHCRISLQPTTSDLLRDYFFLIFVNALFLPLLCFGQS